MESDVRVVVFAPRDFEAEAILNAFVYRKAQWMERAPLAGRYRVFCYAANKPHITVVICTSDDQTGTHFARRALNRLLSTGDSRLRPTAFFVCGTAGAALHLQTKDGANIGDILIARTSLALSNISIGEKIKIRGPRHFSNMDQSDIGNFYSVLIDTWKTATTAILQQDVPVAFFRVDNLTSDVKIGDPKVMQSIADAPGIESCEMELGEIAALVAETYGGVNEREFPTVQMIKGISDFVGAGHGDANRKLAAENSAGALLALLEIPQLRAELNARHGSSRAPSRGQAVVRLLEKIAASVRTREGLTANEWEKVKQYAYFDTDAYREVLEAIDQACGDACPGCGSRMKEATGILHDANPLLQGLSSQLSPVDLLLPNIVRSASAASLQNILNLDGEFVARVVRFQPTIQQAEDYRLLLLSLLYLDIDQYEIAEEIATRMVEVTEIFTADRPDTILRAMSCRLCMLARHCRPESVILSAYLLDRLSKADMPPKERENMELAVRTRFFQYEVTKLSSLPRRSVEYDDVCERLIGDARRLLIEMKRLAWNAPNIWLTGTLVSVARLTSKPEDIERASESVRRFLASKGQQQHCLYDIASWCALGSGNA